MMMELMFVAMFVAIFVGIQYFYHFINIKNAPSIQGKDVADHIERLLPQTQCGQCHYEGCRPYALAIASGEASIDQCPPGGQQTVTAIRDLLGKETKFINLPLNQEFNSMVATIDEDYCIGCVKCINACPVDAIVGAPKQMHTVIKGNCTGCELCIPPCPVNCIDMVPTRVKTNEWVWEKPEPAYRESR